MTRTEAAKIIRQIRNQIKYFKSTLLRKHIQDAYSQQNIHGKIWAFGVTIQTIRNNTDPKPKVRKIPIKLNHFGEPAGEWVNVYPRF